MGQAPRTSQTADQNARPSTNPARVQAAPVKKSRQGDRDLSVMAGQAAPAFAADVWKAGALPWQHSLSTTCAFTAGIPMEEERLRIERLDAQVIALTIAVRLLMTQAPAIRALLQATDTEALAAPYPLSDAQIAALQALLSTVAQETPSR